jgi:hypothetical protein
VFVQEFAEGLLARIVDTGDEELKSFLGLEDGQ